MLRAPATVCSCTPCSQGRTPRWHRYALNKLQPWTAHGGAEQKCVEKGAAERYYCGLTAIPIPHPHTERGGKGAGDEGVKLSL